MILRVNISFLYSLKQETLDSWMYISYFSFSCILHNWFFMCLTICFFGWLWLLILWTYYLCAGINPSSARDWTGLPCTRQASYLPYNHSGTQPFVFEHIWTFLLALSPVFLFSLQLYLFSYHLNNLWLSLQNFLLYWFLF